MKRFFCFLLVFILAAITFVCSVELFIYLATRPYRFTSVEAVPQKSIAIVFGAQVRRDGSLSPILRDRVDGAIALYQAGKVKKFLMTGDNGSHDYDEVSAMRRYALAKNIPKEAIVLDYAGFSTYESCYRAKDIFGISEAILITQKYHLPRAVYTCRKLGIKADGFGIRDWSRYPYFMVKAVPREVFAHFKMLWQLFVSYPKPKFLGPKEIILY